MIRRWIAAKNAADIDGIAALTGVDKKTARMGKI
jgi:hypothetical protein